MSDLMLDVDQAGELKAAFRRGNWTNAEVKRLSEGDLLAKVRNVVRGFSAITPILHAIDCDADPFIPDGWIVLPEDQLPNRVKGIFTWEPTKVKLYPSKKKKGDRYILGHDLREELANQSVLNVNLLDYLLKPENQHLIPEDWKGKYVFFWGTIYRSSYGSLYVRYLYWFDGAWGWGYGLLDDDFSSRSPAALAS
jgi:hypothetical protein